MNNSLELSKQLLEIVNLPPEKRNDALMQFLIYIEEVQYDMNTEQKNLLISIVNDLILENNAQQIVKSKLVFLKNKNEEIAPSKKTKEKKVIVPVVQKIEEDTSFYSVDDDDEMINKDEEIVVTKPVKEVAPIVVAPKISKTIKQLKEEKRQTYLKSNQLNVALIKKLDKLPSGEIVIAINVGKNSKVVTNKGEYQIKTIFVNNEPVSFIEFENRKDIFENLEAKPIQIDEEKKVKTKTTKTKVEADLSFLDDLDNIF